MKIHLSSQKHTPNSLRQAYLDYFAAQGHAIIPSSNLVPENDPTTLFTGSGMQPMVPYLLGEKHPLGTRIADSQRCFRSQDIEDIGDNRHTTYFEMLGNWSLGDYFKKEQLTWFFTFLTKVVGLNPEKLFVTVFGGNQELGISKDDESIEIWQTLFAKVGIQAKFVEDATENGMQDGKIFSYNEEKNWWSRAGAPAKMPEGEPGGPDSEVFYDFGAELQLHEHSIWKNEPCHVNCDCGRFLEIGNSVFMQFQKQANGSFARLPQQNVDFGGGLERILAASQNTPDVFQTDFFLPIISQLEKLSGKKYLMATAQEVFAMRIIADHVRASVMLISDGVLPGNKEQGYFVRRLLRRSLRYGDMLNLSSDWIAQLIPSITSIYEQPYPIVKQAENEITQAITDEARKFQSALKKGLTYLQKQTIIDEKIAFFVYETHGFPFELTAEIASQRGMKLNQEVFQKERESHAVQSRTASAGMFKGGLKDHEEATVAYHTATHLLHSALRKVLGDHVQQKGSNITGERLRFDFTHSAKMSEDELKQVANLVQSWIDEDLPVSREEKPKAQALQEGALAFFGQKYPELVSVYTIGNNEPGKWISKELCGGPHVKRTGLIGKIELFKEQSVSAGIRRIYLRRV